MVADPTAFDEFYWRGEALDLIARTCRHDGAWHRHAPLLIVEWIDELLQEAQAAANVRTISAKCRCCGERVRIA